MKNTLAFFFSILFMQALFAQTDFSKAKAEVMKILKKQETQWNSGNIDAFMEGYWKNDSLVFVGKNGPTFGYKNTLENYKRGYPTKASMGKLSFTFHHFKMWDKTTFQVVGEFHLEREEDHPFGFFTLLLKRMNGQWKIVSDHSSSGQ